MEVNIKDRYEELLKKKIQLEQEIMNVYREKLYLLNQEIEIKKNEEGNE